MFGRSTAAVGAGAYVGGTTAAVLLVAAALEVVSPQTAILVGVGLAVLGALSLRVGLEPRRFERLRKRRVAVALLAVPVACSVAAVAVGVVRDWAAVGSAIGAAAVAFAGWFALVRAAKTLHARRLLAEGGERIASLPEVVDRMPSRRLRALNAALGGLMLVGGAVAALRGEGPWFSLLVAAGPLAAAAQTPRSVTVTDRGLLFETRFEAKLLEWSAFEGYYLGDELVLFRATWWRDELEFDRDEVDEAAVSALDRHLPRASTRAVPAGGIDPDRDGPSGRPQSRPE